MATPVPISSTPVPVSTPPSKPKTAFITGISGQDGSYLAEYLAEIGYIVHGIVRRHSVPENQTRRLEEGIKKFGIKIHYGDLTDSGCLMKLLYDIQPDEIYNLAAQSHVRISFDMPSYTVQTDALGALNMLEAFRVACPKAHYYQASSSEMYGNSVCYDLSENSNKSESAIQTDETPMKPVSPYGCAKLFAHHLTINYRHSYGLFACNGILFNHESPRRGTNFVTSKVVHGAVKIKLGLQQKLELGNMDTFRDWGHAKDYVKAMHLMLNHSQADDFIIATGETHSVRELCDYVFSKLGLNYQDYVVQNPIYMRPEELDYLKGDASRARQILGWKPEYTFQTLLDDMIDHAMKLYSSSSPQ